MIVLPPIPTVVVAAVVVVAILLPIIAPVLSPISVAGRRSLTLPPTLTPTPTLRSSRSRASFLASIQSRYQSSSSPPIAVVAVIVPDDEDDDGRREQ